MSAALGLHRLQLVDSQIDRVRGELAAIQKALEDESAGRAARERMKRQQVEHKSASTKFEVAEAAAAQQQAKLAEVEAELYGGKVRSPKELEELQAEAAALKRHLASLEERELEALEEAEQRAEELRAAEGDLAGVQEKFSATSAQLTARRARLAAELERLETERNAALAPIPAELVREYESLRRTKRGLAVAEVRDQSCAACGTTLTAAFQQLARSPNHVQHCPTCGRVVYAP